MILCICGPTGVGKTKLSIQLAKKYNAIIVNADAMQVYKGMDIGTAKVKKEEQEGICHLLFDIKEVFEDYSVYDYQKDARKIIDEYNNKNIIFVGGSGLYMKAALFDYEFNQYRECNDYSSFSNEELYQLCLKKDSNVKIDLNNRQRLISFLNRKKTSNNKNNLLYDDVYFIGLTTSRDVLYDRINKRVDQMVDDGLIDEVKKFYDLNIRSRSISTAIGYKELYLYFDKKISKDDAIELIKKKSRNYAKRQYTWFNNQMNVKWFEVDFDNFDNTINEVIKYLEN